MRLPPGTFVGAYEIVSPLGAGGMGEVYRARDPRLDREVAIKILPAASGEASTQRERFIREARAASALVHPNIITIHEIDAAGGVDFIVMEYVRGESLSAMLSRGRLPLSRVLDVGAQIADALAAAHAAGIVHRDLTPGNVMITASGLVKVLDFGIAKRVTTSDEPAVTTAAALTVVGAPIGTPAYMSPEQTLGDSVDGRSDVFSFGVVLYEMLAGQRPFQAATGLSLARQIVHEAPRPLKSVAPDVPDELIAVVDRCLVKEPGDRYESAAALRDHLRRIAAGAAPMPAGRVGADTRAANAPAHEPERRPRPARTWAIAAAVLLVIIVGWVGRPTLVRWLRLLVTPQAQLTDEDASPQELLARATERLRLAYREGNVDLAIEQLDRALRLRSPYPIAEARLSLAYERKNSLSADPEWQKRALAHAERAVADDEQLAMAHVALGAALMLGGQLDRAAAEYQTAGTLEPSNWELLWRLGELATARRDTVGAEGYYRRAAEVAPGEWEAHARLGTFLYRQERYTEAAAAFDRMRELAADNTRAYSNLAATYHQLGRTDEAAAVLQRALEIAPNAPTYSNLGTLLYFQGKYPEAVRAFDEAVKLDANRYLRWGNLGDAVRMAEPGSQKMHDSYRRAIQLAREELAKMPADPNIRSSLAVYLVRDSQTAEALAELDRALTQQALSGAVLFKAALVAEIADQRSRALALLGQALDAGYQLREIRNEPDLVGLRADPEYHKLASKYEK